MSDSFMIDLFKGDFIKRDDAYTESIKYFNQLYYAEICLIDSKIKHALVKGYKSLTHRIEHYDLEKDVMKYLSSKNYIVESCIEGICIKWD